MKGRNLLILCCFLAGLFFQVQVRAALPVTLSFTELLSALDSGAVIRGVIHFQKCSIQTSTPTNIPIIDILESAGFTFDWYVHLNRPMPQDGFSESIIVSKTVSLSTTYRSWGRVKVYAQIIFSKGKSNPATVLITVVGLKDQNNALSLETKLTATYFCPISDDETRGGIVLYEIIS